MFQKMKLLLFMLMTNMDRYMHAPIKCRKRDREMHVTGQNCYISHSSGPELLYDKWRQQKQAANKVKNFVSEPKNLVLENIFMLN